MAVAVQRDAQVRRRLGLGQLVDDVPQPALGRIDQAVHAAGYVQADDQVDVRRLDGFVGAQRTGKRGPCGCQSRKNACSKHGVTSAACTNDPQCSTQKTRRAMGRIQASCESPWKMGCIAQARTHRTHASATFWPRRYAKLVRGWHTVSHDCKTLLDKKL